MDTSAAVRLQLAARVADEERRQGDVVDVWLEGALAEGLVHAYSDIDLRVLVARRRAPWRHRVVDGVRIDLVESDPADLARSRALLGTFDVRFDDMETFRKVRGQLNLLTRLRTARRRGGANWERVLGPSECAGYRRWAAADRAEQVMILTEDLLGLVADGMTDEAGIVWHELSLAVAGLECVVADQPLLPAKWLPALCIRAAAGRPLAPRLPVWSEPGEPWFTPTRRRHTAALLRCWPLAPSGDTQPCPPETLSLGWLPQRYADGWFVRRAAERIPLTEPQMRDWCHKSIGHPY
jgi:hypothetical protein